MENRKQYIITYDVSDSKIRTRIKRVVSVMVIEFSSAFFPVI